MTKEELETLFIGSTIKDRQCIAILRHKIREYKKQINNKEKALARLKRENESLVDMNAQHEFFYEGCGFYKKGLNNSIMIADYIEEIEAQLEQAKEIIKKWLRWGNDDTESPKFQEIVNQSEQFIGEAE